MDRHVIANMGAELGATTSVFPSDEVTREFLRAQGREGDWVALRDDGAWLLERRPDRGLLGGMTGWPTSGWDGGGGDGPPLTADWTDAGPVVRHTFSHFHLRLAVRVARCGADARPLRGAFATGLDPASLPTLMRKVLDAAQPALAADCDTGRAPL
jgi:A/G-specific adenine glycosylase